MSGAERISQATAELLALESANAVIKVFEQSSQPFLPKTDGTPRTREEMHATIKQIVLDNLRQEGRIEEDSQAL